MDYNKYVSDELGNCDRMRNAHKQRLDCTNWKPLEVRPVFNRITGGSPHGFGLWIEGKYHSVDIGALGKVITDLQEEVAKLKADLAASKQVAINYEFESAFAAEYKEKLEAARITLAAIGNEAGAPKSYFKEIASEEQRLALLRIADAVRIALEETR